MRVRVTGLGSIRLVLGALLIGSGTASAQNPNPPASHVVIPNPTPRPADVKQEFSVDPAEVRKKQEAQLLRNQLRAREVWLEANQILFLAQQLQDEMLRGEKGASMASNAAKAGDIEKLAKSVREKLKVQ